MLNCNLKFHSDLSEMNLSSRPFASLTCEITLTDMICLPLFCSFMWTAKAYFGFLLSKCDWIWSKWNQWQKWLCSHASMTHSLFKRIYTRIYKKMEILVLNKKSISMLCFFGERAIAPKTIAPRKFCPCHCTQEIVPI